MTQSKTFLFFIHFKPKEVVVNTEHSAYDEVQKLIDAEKDLSPNCFTLRRNGIPEEGILASLDSGPDPSNPWSPHIPVGKYRMSREKKRACVYHLEEGMHPVIFRAEPFTVVRSSRRTFHTLRHPGFSELHYSLVKAILGRPQYGKALTGAGGTGTVIADNGDECLVSLLDGQIIHFFFPDGAVRSFRQTVARLHEESLPPLEMINLRIADAKTRLALARQITEEGRKRKIVRYLLSGMIGTLRQTAEYPRHGHELREVLLREFFFTLSKNKATFVLPKLVEELSRTDKSLLPMLKRFKYVDEHIGEVIEKERSSRMVSY